MDWPGHSDIPDGFQGSLIASFVLLSPCLREFEPQSLGCTSKERGEAASCPRGSLGVGAPGCVYDIPRQLSEFRDKMCSSARAMWRRILLIKACLIKRDLATAEVAPREMAQRCYVLPRSGGVSKLLTASRRASSRTAVED